MAAHGRRLTGFDQRSRAKIKVATDMREKADNRDHGRAKQTNDYDLQMGGTVGAVHRVVHDILPFLPISRGSRVKGFIRKGSLKHGTRYWRWFTKCGFTKR